MAASAESCESAGFILEPDVLGETGASCAAGALSPLAVKSFVGVPTFDAHPEAPNMTTAQNKRTENRAMVVFRGVTVSTCASRDVETEYRINVRKSTSFAICMAQHQRRFCWRGNAQHHSCLDLELLGRETTARVPKRTFLMQSSATRRHSHEGIRINGYKKLNRFGKTH